MNETALALALEKNMDLTLSAYTDGGEKYAFSKGFEKRMEEIIGESARTAPKRVSISRRLKTALVVAAIFAAGFLIGAARTPLWNFVMNIGSGRISFEAGEDSSPQKTMGLAYTLTDVPEGFELSYSELTPQRAVEAYHNADSGYILFDQQVASSFEEYEVQDAEGSYFVDGDGTQYFICSGEVYTAVKWYNGDYIFSLYSSLDKDMALDLCRTAKLKK